MPKYVCNFDAVKSTCSSLRNRSAELRKNLSRCEANVDSELANWTGDSAEVVKSSNESAYQTLAEDIDTLEVMADYLEEAASVIQAAEDSLSSQRI